MNWQDLGKRLASLGLPALGGALGGPLGAAVGRTIAQRIGAPEDASPDIIAQALEDVEAREKLTELDVELATIQAAHTERMAEIVTADVQHARTANEAHMMTWILPLIYAVMLGSAGYALFTMQIPDANRDMANIAFGALLGAFSTATSYWLGSSRGSAEKQGTIDNIARRS